MAHPKNTPEQNEAARSDDDPMGEWLRAYGEYLDGTRDYKDIPKMPRAPRLRDADRAGLTVLLPSVPHRLSLRQRLAITWARVKWFFLDEL